MTRCLSLYGPRLVLSIRQSSSPVRPPSIHSELLHLYTPSWQLRSSADTRSFTILSYAESRTVISDLSLTRLQLPGTSSCFCPSYATSVSSFKSSHRDRQTDRQSDKQTNFFLKFIFSSILLPRHTRARLIVCSL